MNTVFSNNLKRLRQQKNLTQEQAAEKLGVTAQTVSRWECGTTLPDVMLLPNVAKLYCVTIDDLYKPDCIAYNNYASRLASVYEATRDPQDFIQSEAEFKKLEKSGALTNEDMRVYGIIHQYMMNYCKEKAIQLFDEIIQKGPENDLKTYNRTKHQQIAFYAQIGKAEESISTQLERIKNSPNDSQEWCFLIASYICAKRYDEAYKRFKQAITKFSDNWELYVHGGNICNRLKKYDEAFQYWNKADSLTTENLDQKYSMAFCYEELGEYEKAYKIWCELVDHLKNGGYDIEAATEEKRAQECFEKICK